MAKTNDVKLTIGFADNTEADFKIAEVADYDLEDVKPKITTVNQGWSTGGLSNIFVSESGAVSTGIIAAEIVETTTETIAEGVTPNG